MSASELKELLSREINRVVERYRRTYQQYEFICDVNVHLKIHTIPPPNEVNSIKLKGGSIAQDAVYVGPPLVQDAEYVGPPLVQDVKIVTPPSSPETKVEKLEILDVIKPASPNNSSTIKRGKPIKPREKKITDEKGRQWTSDKVKLKADFMRYQYVRYKEQCKELDIKPDYHKHFMKLVTDVYKTLSDEEKVNNDEIQWV